MNLAPIEQRLKALTHGNAPIFANVICALDPSTVIEDGVVKADTAFVVPIGEAAETNDITTQHFSQDIKITFGVMIAVRAHNDRLGSTLNDRLDTIVKAVRQSLLGFDMGDPYDDIQFLQGELVSFYKGGAFWSEHYITTEYFTQE